MISLAWMAMSLACAGTTGGLADHEARVGQREAALLGAAR